MLPEAHASEGNLIFLSGAQLLVRRPWMRKLNPLGSQPTLSQLPDLHSPRLVHYLPDILAHRHRHPPLAAWYKLVRHNGPGLSRR